MIVLDLLATARRWRVHDPFVSGQADGLSRAMVACLNNGGAVPRWLRQELIEFLLEALWEQPRPAWDREVNTLLRRWREPVGGAGASR